MSCPGEFHPSAMVFLDTEYTNLDTFEMYRTFVWNIGMVVREPDGRETEHEILIGGMGYEHADPAALEIAHFWERHPDVGGDPRGVEVLEPDKAARWVLERIRPRVCECGVTVPVHLAACIYLGDITVIRTLLREYGLPTRPWHYHLIDVESVAIGALSARGTTVPYPFKAVWLGEQLGIPQPPHKDKHTALADARFTRDLFDAATRPSPQQGDFDLAG